METYQLTVCGVDITFKTKASEERLQKAAVFVNESYNSLQSHGSQVSRDRLLAILAVGLTDDLFELQKEVEQLRNSKEGNSIDGKQIEARLQKMLNSINSIRPINN